MLSVAMIQTSTISLAAAGAAPAPRTARRAALPLSHPHLLRSTAHIAGLARLQQRTARAVRGSRLMAAQAMLTTRDDATGVEYPMVTRFWAGDEYRSMGATALVNKTLFFFSSGVYAMTCYVEAEKAAKELGVRYRGGFFETEQDFCDAIMDGAFGKAIQLTILGGDVADKLAETIEESAGARMSLMQQTAVLQELTTYLKGRSDALVKGANLALFFTQTGTLNISVKGPTGGEEGEGEVSGSVNWLSGVPEKSIESPALCRALLEVWLGENMVVPSARPVFAGGAKALLESENIRRQTRKGGSG